MNSKGTSANTPSGERGASAPCCLRRSKRAGFRKTTGGLRPPLARFAARLRRLKGLHGDERGTISILSVFCLLMFTMILVMVTNVARHVDDKLRMQNAADASAYSGGVVLARGMNAVAFTNHLLSDVFAMTAFLREGRDRNAESLTPEILDAWEEIGPTFSKAEFEKFKRLGDAITDKVPKERELVESFGDMTAAASDLTLPVFEYTLAEEVIPRFQQTVIRTVPTLAQQAADEVAIRHGRGGELPKTADRPPTESESRSTLRNGSGDDAATADDVPQADDWPQPDDRPSPRIPPEPTERGLQRGLLWRTNVLPVGFPDEEDPLTRTLPIVDPTPPLEEDAESSQNGGGETPSDFERLPPDHQARYLQTAMAQRRQLAEFYLNRWNDDRLVVFEHDARMSAYYPLWRIATCAQLEQLLSVEYPYRNLPMQIRLTDYGVDLESARRASRRPVQGQPPLTNSQVIEVMRDEVDLNQHLEDNYSYVAVVYRRPLEEMAPGLFRNPLARRSDALTFAQIQLFIPRARKYLSYPGGGGGGPERRGLGGTYGADIDIEISRGPSIPVPPPDVSPCDLHWVGENWPGHWDLLNQHWMVKLVPATAGNLPLILESDPVRCSCPDQQAMQFRTPDLGGADAYDDLSKVNKH